MCGEGELEIFMAREAGNVGVFIRGESISNLRIQSGSQLIIFHSSFMFSPEFKIRRWEKRDYDKHELENTRKTTRKI